jgi:hypothetical protein
MPTRRLAMREPVRNPRVYSGSIKQKRVLVTMEAALRGVKTLKADSSRLFLQRADTAVGTLPEISRISVALFVLTRN